MTHHNDDYDYEQIDTELAIDLVETIEEDENGVTWKMFMPDAVQRIAAQFIYRDTDPEGHPTHGEVADRWDRLAHTGILDVPGVTMPAHPSGTAAATAVTDPASANALAVQRMQQRRADDGSDNEGDSA